MPIFTKKKYTSKLHKIVADSIKSDQSISTGKGKVQSRQTSAGDRKYDPMLSFTGNQGLAVKGTIDQMIMKAIK